MNRRNFHLSLLIAASPIAQARHKSPPGNIDAVARIKVLRISTGPLSDGYLIAPGGRLNWYFTNLGLIAIIQFLNPEELDFYIRRYLDLYLRRLEPNATIQDVLFADASLESITLAPSDSDNSYASTLISLAVRYLRASGNWDWWNTHQNTLRAVLQANVVTQFKSNGLCRVFQPPRTSASSEYGFTMNNCEDHRALRDFAALLNLRGQTTEAATYLDLAHRQGQAINDLLWDSSRSGYRVSDQDLHADTRSFYPGSCCQVFAQAFGVIESSSHDEAAYRFLNTWSPRWPNEAYDPFPWCILGYVAAKRGDTSRAQTQMVNTEARYQSDPGLVTINELGFYQRTRSLLQGLPDI